MADNRPLRLDLDSHDMFSMIAAMPSHLLEGQKISEAADLRGLEQQVFHSIIVAGMGGSAIAGDIVRSYLNNVLEIPFAVCRYYRLPAFALNKALVVCSSYSGDTEETLAAYDHALEMGAKVIAITTGGKLASKAETDGVPTILIKGGLPPRAALGYSFSALLTLIARLGLCPSQDEELKSLAARLKSWVPRYEPKSANNPALQLAGDICGTIPIIYTGYERFDAVALRFKCQINENAEGLAFVNAFPELNHNELVGWRDIKTLDKQFSVVILRDTQDHRRIKARMEIVAGYLRDRGIRVLEPDGHAGPDLERMFYFIQLLDFTSYYLALLNEVDPYPVAAIDYLKEKLAKID